MADLTFVKPERLWLKDHPTFDEAWVQNVIATDPSILGLGDLVVKDKERRQPRAGRLDLLLQDAETNRRYEVEVQLGKTDETHIIRTIEYWDIERRRYPQYDHCAVLVAEEITARLLNVVGLFNGMIPFIAVQMGAHRIGSQVALLFTTVVDELSLGLVDDDEEVRAVTDRAYWESRGTKETVAIADMILNMIRTFDSGFELKYNKFYIGLAKNGEVTNFASFRARKTHLILEIRLTQSEEATHELEGAGLELMEYDKRWGKYRVRLAGGEVKEKGTALTRVLKKAYDRAMQ